MLSSQNKLFSNPNAKIRFEGGKEDAQIKIFCDYLYESFISVCIRL